MTSLGLLNINRIDTYMSCNYVFKSLNGLITCDWFSHYHNIYSTRSTEAITLNVPLALSWQAMTFLRIAGADAWNRLPNANRECDSLRSFKIALRSYLLATPMT